jgi:hypothetical protein
MEETKTTEIQEARPLLQVVEESRRRVVNELYTNFTTKLNKDVEQQPYNTIFTYYGYSVADMEYLIFCLSKENVAAEIKYIGVLSGTPSLVVTLPLTFQIKKEVKEEIKPEVKTEETKVEGQ